MYLIKPIIISIAYQNIYKLSKLLSKNVIRTELGKNFINSRNVARKCLPSDKRL